MRSLFLCLLTVISANALAKSVLDVSIGQPACFGREYSTAHMEKNQKQTVKKMTVKFYTTPYMEGSVLMDVDALIKTSGQYVSYSDGVPDQYVMDLKPYKTTMACSQSGENLLTCSIDCDGGSAEVTWEVSKADKEIVFTNKGFVLYGGCGEEMGEEVDSIFLNPTKGGDDVFKLYALPEQYCQE